MFIKMLNAIFGIVVFLSAPSAFGQGGGHLFSRDGRYLGNTSNNPYDQNSINNPYGRYGSKYSQDSINNQYGRYGNPYSNQYVPNPSNYNRNRVGW